VLRLEPARAEPELDPAAAHRVDLRDLDGEQPGQPEGRRRDHRAEADAAGLPGQRAERHPRVRRAGQPVVVAHDEEVVRAEEGVEAPVLGRAGDRQLIVVRRALLRLDHDPEVHGRQSGHIFGALRLRRPRQCSSTAVAV
jgi:hypothetical protein